MRTVLGLIILAIFLPLIVMMGYNLIQEGKGYSLLCLTLGITLLLMMLIKSL